MKNDFKSKSGGEKRPRKPGGFNPNKTSRPSAEGDKRYSFRDNPKTYNNKSEGSGSGFSSARPASKPHVSKFDPNDKYGSKKMDGDSPRFGSNDRPERKPFGDRPARQFDSDKPRFGGGDRPERKPFGDRPARQFDSDKPRFGGNDRPERKPFGDRPARQFDNDKPRFGGGDRLERKPFGDRPARQFDGDKPRFGGNDRPERKPFGDRQPKSFDGRPPRKFDNDKPNFEAPTERPPGKFDNDKSRFAKTPGRAPRPEYQAPRTPRGPKRFDGPYQKNLNSDIGGAERSNRRDSYRSDGSHFDYESRLKETIEEKNGTIRLNRFIANSGICSRRDADELIEAGQITVNGEVITEMGHQVNPTDTIKYGNKLLNREKMVYLLLNKPKDYITTTEDPQDRKTVMNLIDGACKERIYPVGRLDRNTTGLLLFTNDGELASKLTHPSYGIEKMYQVELDKPIVEEDYQKILKGIPLEDGEIKADSFGVVTPDAMVVGIQIHSGRNHIVRRIFAHLGYEVMKLDRTVFAGLNKKDLPRGNYRMLTEKEVIKLKYLS
jgi:23S rRNA pseudouridine2605 synthase